MVAPADAIADDMTGIETGGTVKTNLFNLFNI
jgi:hypothetical protein